MVIRLVIAVTLLLDAADGATTGWFVPGLWSVVLLDVADGMIARRLGVATRKLREVDSAADFMTVMMVAASGWLTHPEAFAPFVRLFFALVVAQFVSQAPALLKFGRIPPYHSYSARLSGGVLFLAALELFMNGRAGNLLYVAVIVSFISHLDRLVITLILPSYPGNYIKGFWHALQIRKDYVIAAPPVVAQFDTRIPDPSSNMTPVRNNAPASE